VSDDALVALVLATLREGAPRSELELSRLARRFQLAPAHEAALLALGPKRLGLYRRLVERRLASALTTMTPCLDALPGGTLPLVRAFLEAGGPRSPFVRDLPGELLTFAGAGLATRFGGPEHLVDQAKRELVEFEVMAADDDEPTRDAELELERGVALTRSLRVLRLEHATHRSEAPPFERGSFVVAVFRGEGEGEAELRFVELSPLVGSVLDALAAGEPLGRAVTAAADAHGLGLAEAIALVAPTARRAARVGRAAGAHVAAASRRNRRARRE
jgi:hypothetical protein